MAAWQHAFRAPPPERINEFGILDPQRFDEKLRILVVCKETNDWSDEDFAKGYLFPVWMGEIFEKGPFGHMQKHPKMWYNLGRWIALLRQPTLPNETLASMKREAIDQLRTVAYTNLNKVRGSAGAGKEYHTLLQASVVAETLRREVAILQPHTVLCCGTYEAVKAALPDFVGRLIPMPHPGAFKSTSSMLEQLRQQDKEITL